MPANRAVGFLGRTRERERLDGILADVRRGRSAVLLISGEPGIGKSALLRYAARQASGLRVAHIAGVQAEMELPFAGIHRLCAPMFDRLDALPEPQQNALSVALGISAGDAPDRFLVALATLSLLCAVAEERPLLCLVDDAQWLDVASGQVLGFVARRLLAESVAMVLAVREPVGTRAFDGLPDLPLEGMGEEDARALLARAVIGRLDDRVRDRIIAETHGNPLALLELSRSMSVAETAAGYGLPGPRDLPRRMEEQFVQRVRALPEATQRLILLAAAEPLGDATLVWRAAARLSVDVSTAAPAAAAGLLDIDDRVRFRHPLVRSGVYRAASPVDRQRVHEALAEVSNPELDADRRAWHRALAAPGPDEAVAAELEHSAQRARTRGGVAGAAALLERAVALTAEPAPRARRALAAADASIRAGARDEALALVAIAEAEALDDLQHAQAELLRGRVAFASGAGGDAPGLLLRAARRLEPLDLDLARETYLTAWTATRVGVHPSQDSVVLEICRAARALPPRPGDPPALDLLLDGLALLATDGRAAAAATLGRAAKALSGISLDDVVRWGWLAPGAALAVWDDEAFRTISSRQVELVRDAGALSELPMQLTASALAVAWTGDFGAAAALLAESDSVVAATRSRLAPFALLALRAWQGREAQTREAMEQAAAGSQRMPSYANWAAAVLFNGLARYEAAGSAARQAASATSDPWFAMWALAELVEAAVRGGDAGSARGPLEQLVEATQPSATDWALGIEARSEALVSEGAVAERLHREAIDRLGRTQLRPELARAHLLFGEWLRREGDSVTAREQLGTAEAMFVAIGMEGFAERTRSELVAAGAHVRRRPVESREELTPHEEQIARLARDGLTNSEIGGRLFLSPRTVEWHLRKVFVKLGIESRNGLRTALSRTERQSVS